MQLGTAYLANRIVRYVKMDMLRLRRLDFDFVVHTFSEFDFQFQRVNLQKIVAISQECGLKVYLDPWGIGNVFGGEAYSDFVTNHYHDSCQVTENGDRIFLACPNAPAFQNYMVAWTETALSTGADGIFWDEPHFNNPDYLKSVKNHWACRCPHCQQKYRESQRNEMPTKEDQSVRAFKQASLIEFLKPLFNLVHQACKRNILYLPANLPAGAAYEHWEPYAQLPTVDVLSSGLYWMMAKQPVDKVADYALIINNLASTYNKDQLYWIQNLQIESGREKEIITAIELCYQSGMRNFALWCFEGGEHESWAACDHPRKAWRTAVSTLRQLKSRNKNLEEIARQS